MVTKDKKTRLFEVVARLDKTFKPKLNESDAFNDASEPLMTHQQFNAYSEPSEPEFDDRNDYEVEQNPNQIVKEIQKHFNTILESYNSKEYTFLTKGKADLNLYFFNNKVSADAEVEASGENKFPEQDIEEVDINELFQFFEPYRKYILTGTDAEVAMDRISKQNSADSRYASQERSYTGGFGESKVIDKREKRLHEVMGRLDKTFVPNPFDKFTIQVKRPDYQGTIRRSRKGWMLYDVTNSPEEAGPFGDLESLMDFYDIDKSQMTGDYVKNLREDMNSTLDDSNINEILNSYLETALWAEANDENELEDKTIYDIEDNSKQQAISDIKRFMEAATKTASDELSTYDNKAIGHNLWLSRNGHGAGFFDDNNDKLQNIARGMKPVDIYLGDDGKVYIS